MVTGDSEVAPVGDRPEDGDVSNCFSFDILTDFRTKEVAGTAKGSNHNTAENLQIIHLR
jgi:hypothetical protein